MTVMTQRTPETRDKMDLTHKKQSKGATETPKEMQTDFLNIINKGAICDSVAGTLILFSTPQKIISSVQVLH